MRTTLNLPDTLINEVIEETGINNKTSLIITALEEMLYDIKRKKLKKMRGKLNLSIDLSSMRKRDMI